MMVTAVMVQLRKAWNYAGTYLRPERFPHVDPACIEVGH